jgi:hypothetical protein
MKKAIIVFLSFILGFSSIIIAQREYYLEPYMDYSNINYCLTWEANTGKSLMYYWDTNNSNWTSAEINLPALPVTGAKGKIMIKPYLDNNGITYYLAWDISTGKSNLYSWSNTNFAWEAAAINLPEKPIPGAIGNIRLEPYMDLNGYNYCLAWAENTGKSLLYYWNRETYVWDALPINLPEKPIPGATGKIMMKPYLDQTGNSYCLTWEISTGKSLLYYWNNSTSVWDALPVNLPEKPIVGTTGNIMLEPYSDNNGTSYCQTWAETGGKSILYYWNSNDFVWDAATINLPENPVVGATGKIMIKPYMDGNGNSFCMTWDRTSGKSALYLWSNDSSNWEALEINLPPAPVPIN